MSTAFNDIFGNDFKMLHFCIMFPSPAPCQFKRPELSTPENGGIIDLDDTGSPFPGNPSTPRFDEGPSPSTQAKRACHEFDLPFVKTTSLAHKNKKVCNG